MMQPKRTHYEIYWEILTFCRNPKSFTSIINRCNLNSKIGQVHLEFLKNRHFLIDVQENGMTLLKATDSAKEYIALFNKTYRELFDDSPEFKI
jgi:predicted transcriptional regulator